MSEEMQQPIHLRFLEMTRELSSALPSHLVNYQYNSCAEDLNNYRNFLNSPDAGEPLEFSDAALAILFHHIAFETFAAFQKLQNTLDGEGSDAHLSDINSPAVRNFWDRYIEQRKASRAARAQEILSALTREDRDALMEAGVRFPPARKAKSEPRRLQR